MPTVRQKRVAKLIVENATLDKPLNAGQMLEKVSYSEGIQKQPNRVLESEGVQEALADLGFTEDNAKRVVTEIMLNPDADNSSRLKATDQVFKVQGSYAPERHLNTNINVDITPEKVALAQEYEQRLKETF